MIGDIVETATDAEHDALRDAIARFVDREVIPSVADRERNADYPSDLLPALGELGVLALHLAHQVPSGCRERHDSGSAVARVRRAGDVAAGLERVDEPGDVARTHLEALGECMLG